MKRLILPICLWFTFGTAVAQTSQADGNTTKRTRAASQAGPSVSAQLLEMKQAIEAQQQQIQRLGQQVQSRDQRIQQLEQRLDQYQATAKESESKADTAVARSSEQDQTVVALKSDVADLKSNITNTALSLQETQKNVQASIESPTALHFKGITITPGGFLAAESVWRQHALASDVNTPFNSIPFSGAAQAHIGEFYGSGRQSRLSMLAEGRLGSARIGGYIEADFLSAGITSNSNQSNSYSMRQRQVWGQAALDSGWTFTGGQMWSLITETKSGLDNRTEALPMTIDANYNVGFSWARQYGFRVTKNFDNKVWAGFSVENAQTTLGGHGQINNFVLGEQGTSGGLYNPTANYSFNASPDLVFKLAAQPGFGHYEVFGVMRDFRDRIYQCATITTFGTCSGAVTSASNQSKIGGGFGGNVRGTLAKRVDVGFHALAGNGIGRYGSGGLPDVIAEPDGSLTPLRTYQSLATLELHGSKLDVYANVGDEYAERRYVTNSLLATNFGYGSPFANNSGCGGETLPTPITTPVSTPPPPGSTTSGTTNVPVLGPTGTPISNGFNPGALKNCNGDTRNLIEGTIGFWYKFYNGPKGRLQWGPQYSYIVRNTWQGTGGDPSAKEGMILTSFRYYLP